MTTGFAIGYTAALALTVAVLMLVPGDEGFWVSAALSYGLGIVCGAIGKIAWDR